MSLRPGPRVGSQDDLRRMLGDSGEVIHEVKGLTACRINWGTTMKMLYGTNIPYDLYQESLDHTRKAAQTHYAGPSHATDFDFFAEQNAYIQDHIDGYVAPKAPPRPSPKPSPKPVQKETMPSTKKYTPEDIAALIAETQTTIDKANELVASRQNDGLSQDQIDRLDRLDRENGLGDHATMVLAFDERSGVQVAGISLFDAKRRGLTVTKILKGGAR